MAVIEPTPRISSVKINKWIRKEIAPIERIAPVLGMLRAHGRMSFNHDEADIRWRPRLRRVEPETSPGYPHEFTFGSAVRHKNAVLPWRAYKYGEQIPKLETLIGRSNTTAFPKLIGNVIKWTMDDFQYFLQKAVYKDGTSDHMHGLASFYGASGLQSGQPVATPSGTYAELSMALGQTGFGGTWTGTWPDGDGDSHYCAWSPLTVVYDSSELGGSAATWTAQWQRALRYAYTYLLSLQGEMPNVAIMPPDLMRKALDSLESIQRMEVTTSSKIVDLGIKTRSFEGIEIIVDAFCPSETVYILNTKRMNLWSMQSQLIETEQAHDIDTSTDKIAFDAFLNMWVESPAYFARLTTTAGY